MRALKTIFLICLFYKSAFSQEIFSKLVTVNRENPDIKYNTVYFDSSGLMWLGTSDGLYQYDGNEFVVFSLPGKNPDNDVTAIMRDGKGVTWAGYRNGRLARLVNNSLTVFDTSEHVIGKTITAMLQSKNGVVWIATAGDGVFFFKNNRLHKINQGDGLSNDHVYSLAEDVTGRIWSGTDEGISVCQPYPEKKVLHKLSYKEGLPDEIIKVLRSDKNGNIWIGMQDKGICKFDFKKNKIVIPFEFQSWEYGQVNNIFISGPEFWVATEENGVLRYNHLLKETVNHTSFGNVKMKKITDVLKDFEGNIWLASNNNLVMTQGSTLKFINEVKGKKINFVHTILCTKDNRIFFTPDQQLTMISATSPEAGAKEFSITSANKLIDIVSLYEDSCGYIWVGTMGEGLFRMNPQTGKKQKITGYNTIDKSSILSIDGSGNQIWLGTLEGVLKCTIIGSCNKEDIQYQLTGFENRQETGNYFIYKVFVDSRRRVWFGTDGKGLVVSDKNSLKSYYMAESVKSNVIYSITEDINKNIWFSTDSGVYKFDGVSFINYNLKHGLRELVVNSIKYDGNGNIICVNRRGLDVLNIKSGVVHYFDLGDASEEINSDLNSISADPGGNVWIGTEKGILKFNSRFKDFESRSVSLITKVTLLTDNSCLSGDMKLKHDQNNIAVEFTGIWYSNPEIVKYQYRLFGYDKNWISTRDRKIIFPNLAPGEYIFKLKSTACNNFDLASETSFSFTINKPFWDESWFRVLLILILAGTAFLFLKIRDRNIQRVHSLEREKIKFQFETLKSQVNPHFLFNSFNTLISIIEKDKNIAVEYVENLSEYFRNLIYYRDKDLIPLKEEIELSSSYYFLQQKRFGRGLHVIIDIDKSMNQRMVPPLVVQILMENAIKHNAVSKETPLTINIGAENDKLVIKNNINPRYSAGKSPGTGIKNIIDRYELLTKEKVEVIKTETEFIVYVPLIKIAEA